MDIGTCPSAWRPWRADVRGTGGAGIGSCTQIVNMPFNGGVAAPTFEVYDFEDVEPTQCLADLAARVARNHPELAAVADAVAGL